jgi:hypothetical protein
VRQIVAIHPRRFAFAYQQEGGMIAARTPNTSHAAGAAGWNSQARTKPRSPNWAAKLRPDLEPEIVTDKRFGDRLLLPTPLLVAEEITRVPAGLTISVSQLRGRLAERFGADRTCPLMTGMFIKIVAGAVAEDLAQGRKPRWPVWPGERNGTLWAARRAARATRLRTKVWLGRRAGHGRCCPLTQLTGSVALVHRPSQATSVW